MENYPFRGNQRNGAFCGSLSFSGSATLVRNSIGMAFLASLSFSGSATLVRNSDGMAVFWNYGLSLFCGFVRGFLILGMAFWNSWTIIILWIRARVF